MHLTGIELDDRIVGDRAGRDRHAQSVKAIPEDLVVPRHRRADEDSVITITIRVVCVYVQCDGVGDRLR